MSNNTRRCKYCGTELSLTVYDSYRKETSTAFAIRQFCNMECYNKYRTLVAQNRTGTEHGRYCINCGKRLVRHRHTNGRLESMSAFRRRVFCSVPCRAEYMSVRQEKMRCCDEQNLIDMC